MTEPRLTLATALLNALALKHAKNFCPACCRVISSPTCSACGCTDTLYANNYGIGSAEWVLNNEKEKE